MRNEEVRDRRQFEFKLAGAKAGNDIDNAISQHYLKNENRF